MARKNGLALLLFLRCCSESLLWICSLLLLQNREYKKERNCVFVHVETETAEKRKSQTSVTVETGRGGQQETARTQG